MNEYTAYVLDEPTVFDKILGFFRLVRRKVSESLVDIALETERRNARMKQRDLQDKLNAVRLKLISSDEAVDQLEAQHQKTPEFFNKALHELHAHAEQLLAV